jgi:hypothetical protein
MIIFFENLQNKDFGILLSRDQNKIRNFIEKYTDLGLYVLNIININIRDLFFDFKYNRCQMMIDFEMELINPEDYYATIGAYKLVWENICKKELYSKTGLRELAKDLKLNYENYDDNQLCFEVGQVIEKLTWADFE